MKLVPHSSSFLACLAMMQGVIAHISPGAKAAGAADNPPNTHVPNEVLVLFEPESTAAAMDAFQTRHGLTLIRDYPALASCGGPLIRHLRTPDTSLQQLLAVLNEDPMVKTAEPNGSYRLSGLPAPNDTLFNKQWALDNTGQLVYESIGTPGADIRFLDACGMAKSSVPETVVAVLDNGVDLGHIDIANNLWRNAGEIPWDGIDNDANGKIDDVHGYNFHDNSGNPSAVDSSYPHGTAVAGIICAAVNNTEGISGVSSATRVMTLRITDNQNVPDAANELAAINYVLMMKSRGVNIVAVNASYETSDPSTLQEAAIQAAAGANIVFCCAAGNGGTDNTFVPVYPANYRLPNMIVVAASNANDELSPDSNYGSKVDLAAPGDNIQTTSLIWPTIRPTPEPVASKVIHQGTTYSAPLGMMYSGTTTGITAPLTNCGLGLSAADFPSGTAGTIALIERGGPTGSTAPLKALNAMKAGAAAVVFYNDLSSNPIPNSLQSRNAWVPAIFLTRPQGLALIAALPTSVTIESRPVGTWVSSVSPLMPNGYTAVSGTSTATPFVSAAVAFAAAHYPSETVVQRVARVLDGTAPVGVLAGRVLTGGRLDLTGIIDPDRDQMPDWWETEQFGNTAATAGADPDGDGFSNLQEYRTGTLPNSPFSRFSISGSGVAVNGIQRDFFVTFPTALEVTYRVERSTTLANGSWLALGTDITGTGNPVTVTDPNAANLHQRRFYRVRIISP